MAMRGVSRGAFSFSSCKPLSLFPRTALTVPSMHYAKKPRPPPTQPAPPPGPPPRDSFAKQLRKQQKDNELASQAIKTSAKIDLMWATPFYYRRLERGTEINRHLNKLALDKQQEFCSLFPKRAQNKHRHNAHFFNWQMKHLERAGGANTVLDVSKHFQELKMFVLQSMEGFAGIIGLDNTTKKLQIARGETPDDYWETERKRRNIEDAPPEEDEAAEHYSDEEEEEQEEQETEGVSLLSWASVYGQGMEIPPQFDQGSTLAGLYFSQVESDPAPLTFDDPRGPRPPFQDSATFIPREGDLFLFPGWLTYYSSGVTEGTRITYSFGLIGDWRETNALGVRLD